jgi:hypothetical protein
MRFREIPLDFGNARGVMLEHRSFRYAVRVNPPRFGRSLPPYVDGCRMSWPKRIRARLRLRARHKEWLASKPRTRYSPAPWPRPPRK